MNQENRSRDTNAMTTFLWKNECVILLRFHHILFEKRHAKFFSKITVRA